MPNTKEDVKWAKQVRNDLFLFSSEPDFTEMDLTDLFKALVIADDAYYNDAPVFEDKEYDAIYLFCATADPTNSYFLGIGSEVRGGKVTLPYQMGSLTQAYLGGEMQDWVARHSLSDADAVITEKLDGISSLIVYGANGNMQIAYSRGDGIEGADITRHVSKIKNVPKTGVAGLDIRAEIIFKKADWEVAKTKIRRSGGAEYKNARNATAGLMNASHSDPTAYDYMTVVAYEILNKPEMAKSEQLALLESLGFVTPHYLVTKGEKMTDDYLTKVLSVLRTKSEYEIDGIVIDVDSSALRGKINPSKNTLNPEFARKFKVADASNQAVATVIEVQWNVSKNGYLKPRVKIQPVELVGVTVQHATGFNAKFIKDNGIGPGAQIRITRSGDVIPFIQGVVKPVKPDVPTADVEWTPTGVDLVLKNADKNSFVMREQLIDFAAKMGFEYIGEGNVEAVFCAGFTTPTQLVKMTEFELVQIIGANGKKIFKSIREKTTNQPWYIAAGAHPAFGRGIGVRKMKKLYEAFAGDMTKLYSTQAILGVEGFEFKTAQKITAGYQDFWAFVEDTGMSFAQYEAPKQGGLSGSTFLFTGFRSDDLEQKIVEQGGKISSSVSSKLTYLVAADVNESSGKLKKAREIGTKIITREELEEML